MNRRLMAAALAGIVALGIMGCGSGNSANLVSDKESGVESSAVPESAADTTMAETEEKQETDSEYGIEESIVQTGSSINVEKASENIDGTVYEGELSTGAKYFAYVPDSENYGVRATANPVLMVYGDSAYTKDSAKETAISSGLAQIADREGGPVIFVNPKGEQWSEADAQSYMAVKAMFSDSSSGIYNQEGRAEDTTGEDGTVIPGCYPATSSRIYVFAESSGADFVYENLAAGIIAPSLYVGETSIWRPSALFLLNSKSTAAVNLSGIQADGYAHLEQDQAREVPAVIVNGSDVVIDAFKAQNNEDNTLVVTEEAAQSLRQAGDTLLEGYDKVMEHWMTHDMGRGVVLQRISSAKELGLIETARYFESSTGTIKYYEFLPEDYSSCMDGSVPLVFGFHGGGSSAENYTWSSGWAEVASDNHFMFVAVEQHVDVQPAQIVELLESLEKQYPCIDKSRIYASGFSMGSIKSTACAYEYDNIFAAINPTNAVAFGSYEATANGNIIPTFYNAGLNSFFNMMGRGEVAWGEEQQKGIAQLLKDNRVIASTADYKYDPRANVEFGVFSDASKFDSFALTEVLEDGSLSDPWGYKADNIVQKESEIPGVTATICYFNSDDGNCYTALSSTSYAGHEPLWVISRNAWEFMSQFSRNEDGSLSIEK